MRRCASFTIHRNRCFTHSFTSAGLETSSTSLPDGTVVRCWVPRDPDPGRPNLLLIHGFGANAMWQWDPYLRPLMRAGFNLYVPDLLFFGGSYSPLPDRTEVFQAISLVAALEKIGVTHFAGLVGVSYGGFVGYRIAAMYPDIVEKVVLCCSGVCLEEGDLANGLFVVADLDEAASILLPQTPERLKQLVRLTHYRPLRGVPNCFLADYIHVMCTDYVQEKSELIHALVKGRSLADLPKIPQPTMLIWGEHDQVFPLELAYRLKRHLDDTPQLVVIKYAGHAVNLEKPKEMLAHLKTFFYDVSNQVYDKHKARRSFLNRISSLSFSRFSSNKPLLSDDKEGRS